MAGNVRNIFAEGNTAKGFFDWFDSVLQGLDRLFIITGGPGTGKSALVKTIGQECVNRNEAVEWLHCPFENDAVDGVILTDRKIGLIDGTAPRHIEVDSLSGKIETIDLGEATDLTRLQSYQDEIDELQARIAASCQAAYDTFAEALRIHDEWEKIYIANIDHEKANKVTEELAERFFEGKSQSKIADVRHMYFGAATPKGAVDFIQDLTADMAKRYFIKGRPGSGKSTMLRKLASLAEERGYDVEIYHCGFDPSSLDMIVLPERSIAIFDSTAPHEYFPTRYTDEIIDMYQRTITPGTDEKHAEELAEIKARYTAKMKQATACLAEAKGLRDELKAIYKEATDYEKVNTITADLLAMILQRS